MFSEVETSLVAERLGQISATSEKTRVLMHQSIPAVPIPLSVNRGAFAHVVSPGGGAFAILSRPRGLGISIPRDDPRAFDTRVFERQIHVSLSRRTRPLSQTSLSIRD